MPVPTGDSLLGCRAIIVNLPDDDVFTRAFVGQVSELGFPNFWYQGGAVTPQDAAAFFDELVRTLPVYQCDEAILPMNPLAGWHKLSVAPGVNVPSVAGTYYDLDFPLVNALGSGVTIDPTNIIFTLSEGRYRIQAESVNFSTGASFLDIFSVTGGVTLHTGVNAWYGPPRIDKIWTVQAGQTIQLKIRQYFYNASAVGREGTSAVTYGLRQVYFERFAL